MKARINMRPTQCHSTVIIKPIFVHIGFDARRIPVERRMTRCCLFVRDVCGVNQTKNIYSSEESVNPSE